MASHSVFVDVEIDIMEYKEDFLEALDIEEGRPWEAIAREFRLFGKEAGIHYVLEELRKRGVVYGD